MAEKWYDKSIKQTEIWLKTDASAGLTGAEVASRRRIDGENDIYPSQRKSFFNYLKHLLTDYTSILMLFTLIIAAVFNETKNLHVMLFILATYYLIVIFSYVKSQRILESLSANALPNVKVLRSGRLFMVKQKQLVRGDVIYISTGDIVPCDARLVESDDLEILEVNVTSVTHAVRKDASFVEYHDISPAQQKNMIFASTIVTRGTGRAICCETGQDTLVAAMKKNTPITSHERLEVIDRIKSFCKKWTLVMTAAIMALTVIDIFISSATELDLFGSFMTGLSLAVASMSEFYTAFAYIVLACGIISAVNKKHDVNTGALIKNIDKLDSIKDLTCIIAPRESAFSVRGMKVEKVFGNGDIYLPSDRGYKKNAARVLRYALLSTGLYGGSRLTQNNFKRENIYTAEEEAIIAAAEECGEFSVALESRYPMLQHIGRGGDSRYETTLVMYEGRFVAVVRGEYSSVLPFCRYYTEDGRVYEMSSEKRNEYFIQAEKLSRQGYRVIGVASKDTIYNNLDRRLFVCQTELTFEGFLAVKEPLLPDAAKNVLRCKNAGIKVIMTCAEKSESNAVLAESLGILNSREQIVTSEQLIEMKEGLFRANLDIYTVYEGLNLAQKRMLVRFLQENGEKVGYICSELDEIILMKDANVGFSQSMTISDKAGSAGIDLSGRKVPIYVKNSAGTGAVGCEALKYVSDVIVSEADKDGRGGFNAAVEAAVSAKSIYYNLHRMVKYMISSQLAKLIIVFVSMLLGISVLSSAQILFCGLVMDFAALIIIAFERSGSAILKLPQGISDKLNSPFINNIDSVVIGVLWAVLTLAAAMIMKNIGMITEAQVSTCCFIGFILSQIAMLNECKREQSIFDVSVRVNGAYIALLAVTAGFIALSFLNKSVGRWFSVIPLSLGAVLITLCVPLAITVACEIKKLISSK